MLATLLLILAVGSPGVLTVRLATGEAASCDGVVVIEPLNDSSGTLAREVPLHATGDTPLPSIDEPSRLILRSGRCWAATLQVAASDGGAALLHVWPKRTLRVRIVRDAKHPAPPKITATLQSVPKAASAIASVATDCALRNEDWMCEVPATLLDVRLEAPGSAPVYLWDVNLREADFATGPLKLAPGASLSGWVQPEAPDAGPVEVRLQPDELATDAAVERLASRTVSTVATGRGFFQFRGLAAGPYALSARAPGAATARAAGLLVSEGREYVLPDPLTLPPLAAIDLRLHPPRTPSGTPWQIRLRALTAEARGGETIREEAAADGTWQRPRLEHGVYALDVVSDDGSLVARRDLELRAGTTPLDLTIGEVVVRGTIRVGEEPLEAELRFESNDGRVTMTSDASGTFAGTLPNEGTWQVQVSPAHARQRMRVRKLDVRVPEGETAAPVEIELPGGRIEGIVIDDDRRPVADVEVLVWGPQGLDANAAADATGHFTLIGVPTGKTMLYANKGALDSAGVAHEVTGRSDPAVTLVLGKRLRVEGVVRRTDGRPVSGAIVRFAQNGFRQPPASSGPTGQFTLEVQSGTTSIDLVVLARGLPVKLTTVPIARGQRMEIVMGETGAGVVVRLPAVSRWPFIRRGSAVSPLQFLLQPFEFGPPRELQADGFGFALEPGPYTFCPRADSMENCLSIVAPPGATTHLDTTKLYEPPPRPGESSR